MQIFHNIPRGHELSTSNTPENTILDSLQLTNLIIIHTYMQEK